MAIKKLIGVNIKFAPFYEVDSITNGEISMKAGKTIRTLRTSEIEINEDIKDEDAGDEVTQEVEIKAPGSLSDVNNLNAGPLIISMQLSDETHLAFGSITRPASKEYIKRDTNEIKAKFIRMTTAPEFE